MTTATLVQLAGVLVMVRVGWDLLAVALSRRRRLKLVGDVLERSKQMEISPRSLRRLGLPGKFLVAFFGILSVLRYSDLAESFLGLAVCIALAGYFGLEAWAHVTAKELWVAGYRGRTIVIGMASFCYGLAVVSAAVA